MAGQAAMIAVAAVLLLASSAFGQGNGPTINNNVATPGTSNINKLVPEPLAAKVGLHCPCTWEPAWPPSPSSPTVQRT